MTMPSLVVPNFLQAGPERPRQLLVSGAYSNSLWPFHTYLPVDPVGNAPAHDEIRENGQVQYLDQSSGHDHEKFGGSSLPAGGARATKATAGLSGQQQFTWAISHLLAIKSGGWRSGPRPDTRKQTTPVPRQMLWPLSCQVWRLQLSYRPSQSDQGNSGHRGLQHFTLAISHLLAGRSGGWRSGPRQDTRKRTTPVPKPILWP